MNNIPAESPQNFDIKKLRALLPADSDVQLGDDFLIADIEYNENLRFLKYPCRFDGYLGLFCIKGDIVMDINLNSFHVEEGSFMFVVPGYIVRFTEVDPSKLRNTHFIVVAISKVFMYSIRFDFKKMFNESMRILETPTLKLDGDEIRIASSYLALAADVLNSALSNKKEIVGGLLSSFCYVIGSAWTRKIADASKISGTGPSLRTKMIFEQFLKLVTEYHTSERNMAFYAKRLCLTPKYLSKLIKQASGRSAPDWIDSFVILEAKNMLKYSDCTIKEIVYKLHFPNQSVFYKFFKAHTGMTPSEYRES